MPERTCVGCHARRPKHELVRVAAADGAARLDERQRLPGRGAYFCRQESCWQAGLKRGLSRTLRLNVPDSARHELLQAFTMGVKQRDG